jgi:3-oxoacyl-[acyl-carrier protein] reductase
VGQAVLRALAARDVRATFTHRRKRAQADALAVELGHETRAVDLRSPSEVRALVEDLCARAAPPDLFIHCATIGRPYALAAASDEIAEEAYAVNVRSAFVACRALLPAWAARAGGDVVVLTYVDGAHPTPMPAYFAITQFAVVGLVRALAKEFGARGVRANAVQVGPLLDGVARDLPVPLLDDFERLSAIGRAGTAEDVAKAIMFVALENAYMTGQVFPVQGGL